MSKWYMMTLVGKDKPGIVAHVTTALYEGGCNLGETSMMRLGGNFAIMMMVQFDGRKTALADVVQTVADSFGLHLHVDTIEAHLHEHLLPDVRVTVSGADRAGMVAKVTTALSEVGLHILDLESDVGGTEQAPIYITHIEGKATEGVAAVRSAVEIVNQEGIDASLSEIDTLVG